MSAGASPGTEGTLELVTTAVQTVAAMTDEQLIVLARFVEGHAHRRWCFRVLGLNRHSPEVRDGALRDLRAELRSLVDR